MRRTLRGRALALVCAIGLLLTPLATTASAEAQPTRPAKPVTVMTRNLYLGADINRPVLAALAAQAAGGTPTQIAIALANATHVSRAIVDRTSFPVRSQLLADEIARTEPDLIGLQEVAWWRHGPLQLDQVGVPNATTTDYDFLAILLADLAARGEQYVAVSVGDRADVESPSFTGSPLNGTMSADARDIRLTMRDVVLMHVEDGLTATGKGGAIYSHNLVVGVAGASFRFDRGYQWVDVRAGAQRFRFINTHLEAFSSDLALAQAQELLAQRPGGREDERVRLRLQLRPAQQQHQADRPRAAQGAVRPDHRGRRLHRPVAAVGAGEPGLDLRPVGDRGRPGRVGLRPPDRHGLRALGQRRSARGGPR